MSPARAARRSAQPPTTACCGCARTCGGASRVWAHCHRCEPNNDSGLTALAQQCVCGSVRLPPPLPRRPVTNCRGSLDSAKSRPVRTRSLRRSATPTHYYQRPDAGRGIRLDTTRTSLSGDAEGIQFGKVGAATCSSRRTWSVAPRVSRSMTRLFCSVPIRWRGAPGRVSRLAHGVACTSAFNGISTGGSIGRPPAAGGAGVQYQYPHHIRNTWSFHIGGTVAPSWERRTATSCARAEPAVRRIPTSPRGPVWPGGRTVKRFVPLLLGQLLAADGGRSHNISLSPELDFKLASRVTAGGWRRATRAPANDIQRWAARTDTSKT